MSLLSFNIWCIYSQICIYIYLVLHSVKKQLTVWQNEIRDELCSTQLSSLYITDVILRLKLSRTYFHLSFFHRSSVVFPIVPVDSFPRSLSCLEVTTIEVGVVTVLVPPSTFPVRSTVATTPRVIISVVGRELHAVVIRQRITSITLNIEFP